MSESSMAMDTARQIVRNVVPATEDGLGAELTLPHAERQQPPVDLTTEHTIVFSTAASRVAQPPRRWMKAVRIAQRFFVGEPKGSRPRRRRHPEVGALLEDSRMEREMHRL